MAMQEKIVVHPSSGNVFFDIGVKNPELHKMKVELAMMIIQLMEKKNLDYAKAAKILGTKEYIVANIGKAKLGKIGLSTLARYCYYLTL